MTQLQKYTEPLTLTKRLQYAAQTNMLKDHTSESINDIVKAALLKAKQTTGYNTEDDDLIFFKTEVIDELLSSYKGLHLGEIPIAFDLWAKKHYGEWVGFTVANFITYGLRPFYLDQKRTSVLMEKEEPKKEEPKEWDGTKRLAELKAEFEKNGSCDDKGNIVFDWMRQNNMIEEGYCHKHRLLSQAKSDLLAFHNKQLITCNNALIAQSIRKEIKEIEENKSTMITVEAKKLAINHFFKNDENKNKQKVY